VSGGGGSRVAVVAVRRRFEDMFVRGGGEREIDCNDWNDDDHHSSSSMEGESEDESAGATATRAKIEK